MKRTFLMVAAGVLAMSANGQQATQSVVFKKDAQSMGKRQELNNPVGTAASPYTNFSQHAGKGMTHSTERTTTGGGRWYDYSNYYEFAVLDSINFTTPDSIAFSGVNIWQDTTDFVGYGGTTSTYAYNPFTSYGMLFDPQANNWNNPYYFGYGSIIGVSNSDAYTIDSIEVAGWYNRDYSTSAKEAVVDTLVVAFVQANPATTGSDLPAYLFTGMMSNYGTDTLVFVDMGHDSVNNRAGHNPAGASTAPPLTYTGTSAGPVYKFPLTSTDTNGSNSLSNTQFPRATHSGESISFPVTAGNMVGISVSFISGDTAYYSTHSTRSITPGDTISYSTGGSVTGYKYGNWVGEFFYSSSDGSTPSFGPYLAASWNDWTCGYFKREGPGNYRDGGWGGLYEPQWSWGGPSSLQYPLISVHVSCATCVTVGTPALDVQTVAATETVKAYPNPADNQVTISYTLTTPGKINATLTNVMGQQVASQEVESNVNGNVVFATSSLADGIYIYAINGNGLNTTGRIVVAH